MNKKGFVFMETIIVLIILTVSIVSIYATYYKLSTDIERRKNFDNISDLFKTEILKNELKSDFDYNSSENYISIDSTNCINYMKSDKCSNLLSDLNVTNVFLNVSSITSLANLEEEFNNSMKIYLNTIKDDDKDNKYIIVNYKYNENNYYASLRIEGEE